MQLKTIFTSTRARMVALTLISLSCLLGPAQAQDQSQPPNGWMPYGPLLSLSTSRNGYDNKYLNCSTSICITTADQMLSTNLNVQVYKNAVDTNDGYDYYLISGLFAQAVQNSGNTNNWISVGIYGTNMFLKINGNGARLLNSGPSSTSGETTSDFTVGGGIGAGTGVANGSISFGWSQSNTIADVQFTNTSDGKQLILNTSLPSTKASGYNPEPASFGYSFKSAAVFQVTKNSTFTMTVDNGAQWGYSKPRGNTYENYQAWNSAVINANFTNRQLVQKNSGLCMAVQSATAQNGQPVTLAPCSPNNSDPSQQWSFTRYGQIQSALQDSMYNSYCMDAAWSSMSAGSGVVVGQCVLPQFDVTGKQTSFVKSSQIFRVGQIWNYDQELFPNNPYLISYNCGIYSNTSFAFTYASSNTCNTYPNTEPSSSVITGFTGLVMTSGVNNTAGTPFTFHSIGSQTGVFLNELKSNNFNLAGFIPTAVQAAENQFITVR